MIIFQQIQQNFNMITIKLLVPDENVATLTDLINTSGLAYEVLIEDLEDQTLKPMTATDFYKRINAANLAHKETRVFSQKNMESEILTW